jgi:hypothetical protein
MNLTPPGRHFLPVLLLVTIVQLASCPDTLTGQTVTIALELEGRPLEGTPLNWSRSLVTLLARDGHLWEFAPEQAQNYSQTSPEFRPYDYAEMRGALLNEFDRGFEVSGTGHYIVVHPRGQRDVWANRFEELYRSFQHFFGQRGFQLHEPRIPLVAIVLGSRQDFDRYAARHGKAAGSNVLGYYSLVSNRVVLYDIDDGSEPTEWGRTQNADTIIHEATHQTAFNTGIHNRYGSTPRWVAEGLGTMFEAPGVWDSRKYLRLTDRINNGRLQSYRDYLGRRPGGMLAELIASDRAFHADPQGAYAEAWATTFYLSEREPASLASYLARVGARPSFQAYTPQQRVEDFQAVFGEDLRMMEVRVQRFMAELP